ncbi:glycosyltransferase family 4 protein [Ramlibacter algicola]|uniref:Glycosyltransferase family 4 protein n=1 Tax=Ramlibacter algicola TaxID=2795217 RepID=A0A934Q201_9BURK|nr:glycosyltransferase family 4 protein [Ramlibacter algicola]MBK0393318.1 glycosyltransferase family 4 protein [Ramlibacter algicola]
MTAVLFTESSRNLGGQELQILSQMQLLRQRGIDAVLACRPDGAIAARAHEAGLETVPVPLRNAADPVSLVRLARLLRSLRPAAVMCHSGHDANCAALAHRLVPGRRRLVRVRTYLAGRPRAGSFAGAVASTLVPSDFLKRDILRAAPAVDAERVQVLYPYVDFDRVAADASKPLPEDLARWLQSASSPLIVHAAMLRPEKGHHEFLQVLAALRDRLPSFRYVAAGQGDLRAGLVAEAERLGLGGHVHFAGLVTPVAALLARADVVVLPSLVEPLGLAQVEAMGLGRPVVASAVGGIPETIEQGRTGLLVAPGDVTGWVDALLDTLSGSGSVAQRANAGRAAARHQFSGDRHLDGLLRALGIAND